MRSPAWAVSMGDLCGMKRGWCASGQAIWYINVQCNGLAEGAMMGKWPSCAEALEVINNSEDKIQQTMTSDTMLQSMYA